MLKIKGKLDSELAAQLGDFSPDEEKLFDKLEKLNIQG